MKPGANEDKNRLEILRRLRDAAAEIGMPELAKRTRLNRTYVYQALSDDGNPTLETILKIARAVGIEFRFSARR
jgi:probable addiction module antidote protein